ncbi:MAG TPA: hypothetical protein VIU12_31385 [Chryseolinea sp.]
MKKIFSIALLFVFLFQFVGYYFVYLGLRHQAKTEMISRLDARDYSQEETVTLKIPFALPYWMDSKDYERVDGEFQHEGQFYKLVEQKLEKDTLYVVCIRDTHEKKLFDTMSDYAKLANDLPTSSHQTLKLLSGLMKDYVPGSSQHEITLSQGWTQECSYAEPSFTLLSQTSPVFSPPPEA